SRQIPQRLTIALLSSPHLHCAKRRKGIMPFNWLELFGNRETRRSGHSAPHQRQNWRRFVPAVESLEARMCPNGAWTSEAPMLLAREFSASAVINGQVYVAGGQNGHETPTLQAYNPATNTWAQLADMPSGRYQGDGAAVINAKLYVPGGWD